MALRFAEVCAGKIGPHALAKASGIPYPRVVVAWLNGPLLLNEAQSLLKVLNRQIHTSFSVDDLDMLILESPEHTPTLPHLAIVLPWFKERKVQR